MVGRVTPLRAASLRVSARRRESDEARSPLPARRLHLPLSASSADSARPIGHLPFSGAWETHDADREKLANGIE